MYKRALGSIAFAYFIFLLCCMGIRYSAAAEGPVCESYLDEAFLADDSVHTIGMVSNASSGQRVVDCGTLEKELRYNLPEEELEVLYRIVEAEAGTEDEDGRLLVANVIFNRMESEDFPDTVSEVVFQKENGVTQFSPVGNGRIWKVTVSDTTKAAVTRALEGEDLSQGALYFAARKYAESAKMKWFDSHLTFLFQHGAHEFFTASH